MDRFYRKTRDPVLRSNRIAIDPDGFLIAIPIAPEDAGRVVQFPRAGIIADPVLFRLFQNRDMIAK